MFSDSDFLGGRAATAEVDGEVVEIGASVIHHENAYMSSFADDAGLAREGSPYASATAGGSEFGVWDGKAFVYEKRGDDGLLADLRSLWRYGSALRNLPAIVNDTVRAFGAVYSAQRAGASHASMHALMRSLRLEDLVNESLASFLRGVGQSKRVVDELACPVTRVNYGQSAAAINAFAGLVSLSASADSVWRVRGGNWRIAEALAVRANASVCRRCSVTAISEPAPGSRPGETNGHAEPDPAGTKQDYAVEFTDGSGATGTEACGKLVVAVPLAMLAETTRMPRSLLLAAMPIEYQITHATVVAGRLRDAFFGRSPDHPAPTLIATTEHPGHSFTSIGRVGTGASGRPLYKVFSRHALHPALISQLFEDVGEVKRRTWRAYPKLRPRPILIPFRLRHGLFYTSGAEVAASAMEVMAIAAKNVALLAAEEARLDGDDSGADYDNDNNLAPSDPSTAAAAAERKEEL